jgi:hypothetical protein
VGQRWFRRAFVIDDARKVESASLHITADNSFTARLNGDEAGKGDSFHTTYVLDVAALLRSGTNNVLVQAINGGDSPNPAGLLATLTVRLRDGSQLEFPTDKTWDVAVSPEGAWAAAKELGAWNMAPWNKDKTTKELSQYCSYKMVEHVLEQMGIAPDFTSDPPLRYVHRQDGAREIYFVANPEERPLTAPCVFRVSGKEPVLWDPLNGERRAVPDFMEGAGVTRVPLLFAPHQSYFVVFGPRSKRRAAGSASFLGAQTVHQLGGSWEVSFDPRWGGPEVIVFPELEDWSKRPEPGIKFYSGLATYRKAFDLPGHLPSGTDSRMCLDLGIVKNLARVVLNGRDLGVVWCAPWRVDVTECIRQKGNRLEIAVANLWPNRLIGDSGLPESQRLTATTWNPFKPGDRLQESGLIGPVTLVPLALCREKE